MTNLSSVHSSATKATVNTNYKQYSSFSGLITGAEVGLFTGATFNSLPVLKMSVNLQSSMKPS